MSSIACMGWLALATLISPLLGYLMFKASAKYIHVERLSSKFLGSTQGQKYEPYSYEVERYGCVSLLATVLGVVFYTAAVISFVGLLYQIVVIVIIPSLDIIISVVGVLYGIILVFSLVLFVVMAVLGFSMDLFNPPR